ncbi:fumarylacetoacetate hydrolase family protein [Microbacterium sp.]|uniref:fumarylacetoacetate hydrolase family protein n=1 Tax=Microbacterium sp. TaxID=51671 RepID=UPI0039C900CA
MRLATVRTPAGTRAAVEDAAGWVLLEHPDAQALIAEPDWRAQADAALQSPLRMQPEPAEFGVPMPRPAKLLCCGLNYRDHIVETGRAVPEYPTLFAKFADTLTGPADDVVVHDTERLD